MATLTQCQNLTVSDAPPNTNWLVLPTSTNPAHQLRLNATAAIAIGTSFTISMAVETSYTLQVSATAGTINIAVADGTGQWVSGQLGSAYIPVTATLTDALTLLPGRKYIMVINVLAAITAGSQIINFGAKLTPTIYDFFESGLQNIIADPKISVVTNSSGVTTFTFNNYTFVAGNFITLGSYISAKSSGTMTLTSSFAQIPSFTDQFSIYGSVLLTIKSNTSFIGSGTIIVSIAGVGTTSLQGILPSSPLCCETSVSYSNYIKMYEYSKNNDEENLLSKRRCIEY